MPAETKTHPNPHRHASLEGAVFTFQSETDRVEAIDKAFDYRGDVTLTLSNQQVLEGYIFNRDPKAMPPRIELFVKGSETAQVIPYADIEAISFTGKDTADGKSWDAWVNKKESERQAEADRIKAEAEAQGHL
jgi:hypothetical protein